MVEITVKAVDSASAMEEVEKRLGADALIVSTNRVDGQIEIVATNDEPSKYQKTLEPLVLDKNYRIKGFSDVLNSKLSDDDKPFGLKDSANLSQIAKNAENIKSEIDRLVQLSSKATEAKDFEQNANNVFELFQMAGVKKSLFESHENLDAAPTIEEAAKIIAKSFIHGKCDNFESSKIYILKGSEGSGKTFFAKKLKSLLESQPNPKFCTILDQLGAKKTVTEIKNWLSKNKTSKNETNGSSRCCIIELSNQDNFDEFLLNISKLESDLKISIINLVPVGNSYEYLMSNILPKSYENEYLAVTKLDVCDLSIPEIAAFVELDHKCMFFSGVPSSDEGLYFAKVGQTVDHIVQDMSKRMD